MIDAEELSGRSDKHVMEVFPGHCLHRAVVAPYFELVERAAKAGIDLRLASGFRSFDRQLTIWNAKVSGERPVTDDQGRIIPLSGLDDLERIFVILRWSALPGASRHHWGTDVDVWDGAAVALDYRVQLSPGEYNAGGVFHGLSLWLDEALSEGNTGFFRPYVRDCGGLAPEPWHLSYRPVADTYQARVKIESLYADLVQADILLKDALLAHLEEIYQRFVRPSDSFVA